METERHVSCDSEPIAQGEQSDHILGSNPEVTSSTPRISNKLLGVSGRKENEYPLQQVQMAVEKFHPMDLEGVKMYFAQRRSQRSIHQSCNCLGKRKRDVTAHHVQSLVEPKLTSNHSTQSVMGSSSQDTRSITRVGNQVSKVSGCKGILQHAIQTKGVIYRELIHPNQHDGNETLHTWAFGAMAELLDNIVDEIPNGATKALVTKVPNPYNGSPSLLVQDDGGGMDPDSLWKCLTAACPNRKSPNSIGQNGKGFRSGIRCLGASTIIFSRCVNTREPTQSIGLVTHFSRDKTCQKFIVVPMVHYKYDTITRRIRRYEQKRGQFIANMGMLLRLSPYSSEEKLLQNFNDIGPHGTKIIVFNLSRNAQRELELDFDTDKKDIQISVGQMQQANKAAKDQNQLVHHYRRSLRAYISILYIGLPKHFKIILRGEEVKRRNLATELKHSHRLTYMHSAAEREEELVIGFLDGSRDDENRICIYNKKRLILPFAAFSKTTGEHRNLVGILEANYLKPARNKQDFFWTPECDMLKDIFIKKTAEFWKSPKGMQIAAAEPSCTLSLGLPAHHGEAKLTDNNSSGTKSRITPSESAHFAAPTHQPNNHCVPRAPAPCHPALSTEEASIDREQRRRRQTKIMAMVQSWSHHYAKGYNEALHAVAPPSAPNGGDASYLPKSVGAGNSGELHRPTMPAATSSISYRGMNFNTSSVPPNLVAPAPHLAALSMSATAVNGHRPTPASSVALTAPHGTQSSTVNTMPIAPSHSVPPGAMVAPCDLPIKVGRGGMMTYDDDDDDVVALPLPGGATTADANTVVGVPSAAPATNAVVAIPAIISTRDTAASAFPYHRCPPGFRPEDAIHRSKFLPYPPGFKPRDEVHSDSDFLPCPPGFKPEDAIHRSARSSTQARPLQDGKKQEDNLRLNKGKAVATVKMERI